MMTNMTMTMTIPKIIILVGTFMIISSIQHIIYKYNNGKKEGMKNDEKPIKNVYLIGDSIIKNDIYVARNKSVEHYIKNNISNSHRKTSVIVTNLAVDNSCINDIYDQLRFIKNDSRGNSVIFLSVGGNDILKKYVYMYNTDFIGFPNLFNKYKELVERIKTEFPEHKLVLMNIYYPPNKQIFSPFYPLITKWNKSMDEYINNSRRDTISRRGGVIEILRADEAMVDKDDFIDNIEPSERGGKKIANLITDFL